MQYFRSDLRSISLLRFAVIYEWISCTQKLLNIKIVKIFATKQGKQKI